MKTRPNKGYMLRVFIVRVTSAPFESAERDFNGKRSLTVIWPHMILHFESMNAILADTEPLINLILIDTMRNIRNKVILILSLCHHFKLLLLNRKLISYHLKLDLHIL